MHWKLRDQTYLFAWLEKNLGVEGMVLVDLAALRTVGIQFGLDQLSGDLVNITMGAYALPLGAAAPASRRRCRAPQPGIGRRKDGVTAATLHGEWRRPPGAIHLLCPTSSPRCRGSELR